jgi:protein-L-isoaspartate(D-aspartate) O-methyltransferase
MTKYQAARKNMVDCQIHTAGVSHVGILDAFSTVPREKFVSPALQSIAHADEDLPLGEDRYLMSPLVHARLLQAANPQPEDVVLDIGGAYGYPAAILSSIVTTVLALEEKKKYIDQAEKAWGSLGICNVVPVRGALNKGHAEHAPYSLIILNGAVSQIPEAIVAQLTPEGRLLTIVKKPGMPVGQAAFVQKNGAAWSSRILFDAAAHYLPGFEPASEFCF